MVARLYEMHKRHLEADVKGFRNYQKELINMDIIAMWYLTQED